MPIVSIPMMHKMHKIETGCSTLTQSAVIDQILTHPCARAPLRGLGLERAARPRPARPRRVARVDNRPHVPRPSTRPEVPECRPARPGSPVGAAPYFPTPIEFPGSTVQATFGAGLKELGLGGDGSFLADRIGIARTIREEAGRRLGTCGVLS